MKLSARVLNDVANVNSFEITEYVSWTEGDTLTVYLQLIDASLDLDIKGFYPSGRRFMPAVGSTLSVQIQNIDSAKVITRTATQPFAEDASIWSFNILATDAIHGSPQMVLTLSQGGVVTKGLIKNAIKIQSLNNAEC